MAKRSTSSLVISSFRSFTQRGAKNSCILVVRPVLFRSIWLMIVALHIVNIAYLGLTGRVYQYLVDEAPIITDTIEIYNVSVPRKYYHAIAAGYYMIATYHGSLVVKILWASARSRRLRFSISTNDQQPSADVAPPRGPIAAQALELSTKFTTKLGSFGVLGDILAIGRSFNPLDPNYDKMHIVRELIENALQTYQAYRSSCLVPRVLMNSCFVGLLVVNCWSTEAIHRLLGSRAAEVRVAGLASNMVLDMVAYMVFPVMLFTPYYDEYLPQRGDLPLRFWYTDSWLSHMYQEWQMLFVTSAWDGAFKFLIAFNVAYSLHAVACMIGPEELTATEEPMAAPVMHGVVKVASKNQLWISKSQVAPAVLIRSHPRPQENWTGRLEAYARRVLVGWGFFVLITHIVASTRGSERQCVVQVRPWFAWRAACSLVVVKCDGEGMTGADGDATHFGLDDAIAHVDEKWISILVIRHCPVIDVTPRIKSLTNLVGFKIHNSTIRRWDQDAAFTATEHPMLMFVFLADVNMTDIPRGLRDPNFPPKLGDIEISKSNLTTLPDNLHEIWPPRMFLVVEGCQFRTFPMVLLKLRPWILAIAMNNFTELPAEVWEAASDLVFIDISGNPVTAIPEHPTEIPSFTLLHLVSTEISALPSWMDEAYLANVFPIPSGHTPICRLLADEDNVANNRTLQVWRENLICKEPESLDDVMHYPLEHELVYNPE